MKILVTGATGFVGNSLLIKLKSMGFEIVVLTRNTDTVSSRLPIHCEVVCWNPDSDKYLPENLDGVNAVINLAGENIADGWWTELRKQKIFKSRTSSVKALRKALEKSSIKPRVFISASAIGFYGDCEATKLEENNSPGNGFLSEVCKAWEDEIFEINKLGIRTVALRIGMVLGHDGGALKKMLPPFKLGLGGKLGNGRQWMSWIHINDLIEIIILAITDYSIEGPINAVSPNPVSNNNFTKILSRILEVPAMIPVPKTFLKFILRDLSELLLNSQRVEPKKLNQIGFKFKYPILDDALREICSHPYHVLQIEHWIPSSRDKVFAFFKEAKNLERITPKFLKFKVLRQSNEKIQEGTVFDYFLWLRIIPIWWKSKIMDWEPNSKFSDIQVRGPYSYWFHTHEFQEMNGGTLMRDVVKYKLPFGIPGDLISEPFVKKDIEKIFNYRKKIIDSIFK